MAKTAALPKPDHGEKSPRRSRLWVIVAVAIVALLAAGGGVAWYLGVFDPAAPETAAGEGEVTPPPRPPVLVELPEVVVGMPVPPGRRASFARVRAQLEVAGPEDAEIVRALMPRVIDIVQTRVREMHRQEFQSQAALEQLRIEITSSVAIATAPAQVTNIIFTELLVQ